MVAKLIVRGLVVGIVAGLLAFAWAKTFGVPAIEEAIGFEEAQPHDHGDADVPEIFSRSVQSGIGLLTGIVVVGAGMGGLFGVLFAFASGRLGGLGPQATSLLLSFFALVSIYIVPALKYPPNPPAVGDPDTIKYRTALYFLLMAISIAATVGALVLRQRLLSKHSGRNASVIAAAAYLVVVAAVFAALPGYNEVPENFPMATLRDFRVAAFGVQVVLWAAIGILFGFFADRALKSS